MAIKPSGLYKIDPNHPLGRHCIFALPFTEGKGTSVRSTSAAGNYSRRGQFKTDASTLPQWKDNGNGPFIHFGFAENAWIEFPTSTDFGPLLNHTTGTSTWSIRARVRLTADEPSEGLMIMTFWNSDPALGNWQFTRRPDSFFDGCYSLYFHDAYDSAQAWNSPFSDYSSAGVWYDIIFVCEAQVSPGHFAFYVDGALSSQGHVETYASIYKSNGASIYVSRNPEYAGYFNGDIDFIEVFDIPLSEGDIKYLVAHPYEEFIPDTQAPSSGGKVWVWTYPNADVTSGLWLPITSGASLYSMIDETVLSDTDYIFSSTTPINDMCEVKLSGLSDPVMSSDHVVVYRYWNEGGGSCSLTVSLYQGASLITETVHDNVGTDPITSSFTLTSGQADSITDYTDLRLRFKANA